MKVCTVNKSSSQAKEGSPEPLGLQLLSDHFLEAICYRISMHLVKTLRITSEGIIRQRSICQNYSFHPVDPEDQTRAGRLGSALTTEPPLLTLTLCLSRMILNVWSSRLHL